MNIERRVDELERKHGMGTTRLRLVHFAYDRPEIYGREEAAAIARDEAKRGPLLTGERRMVMRYGPAGRWIETPHGSRWQYPDGTTTDDPGGISVPDAFRP